MSTGGRSPVLSLCMQEADHIRNGSIYTILWQALPWAYHLRSFLGSLLIRLMLVLLMLCPVVERAYASDSGSLGSEANITTSARETQLISRIGVFSVLPQPAGGNSVDLGFSLLVRPHCLRSSGYGGEFGGWGSERAGGYTYIYLMGSYWRSDLIRLKKGVVGQAVSLGAGYAGYRAGLASEIAEGCLGSE